MSALRVHHGPLPQDGERVNADSFLEAWVAGTTFGNFDASSFDVDFSFISSQTDEPSATNRGRIWFQRGTGKLFFREDPDRGDSRYTANHWCQIAPLREIIVQVNTRPTNTALYHPHIPGIWVAAEHHTASSVLQQYYADVNNRVTQKVETQMNGLAAQCPYILSSTPVSGYDTRAVEWGYCTALFGSGVSAGAGAFAMLNDRAADQGGFSGTFLVAGINAWSGETGRPLIGIFTQTCSSSSPFTATIFKRASTVYDWTA